MIKMLMKKKFMGIPVLLIVGLVLTRKKWLPMAKPLLEKIPILGPMLYKPVIDVAAEGADEIEDEDDLTDDVN